MGLGTKVRDSQCIELMLDLMTIYNVNHGELPSYRMKFAQIVSSTLGVEYRDALELFDIHFKNSLQ